LSVEINNACHYLIAIGPHKECSFHPAFRISGTGSDNSLPKTVLRIKSAKLFTEILYGQRDVKTKGMLLPYTPMRA
jgi:hypothetical protein